MTKRVWIPIVNCGYMAGEMPKAFMEQIPPIDWFASENECQQWIETNMDNFTQVELSGCVCPFETTIDSDSDSDASLTDNILSEGKRFIEEFFANGGLKAFTFNEYFDEFKPIGLSLYGATELGICLDKAFHASRYLYDNGSDEPFEVGDEEIVKAFDRLITKYETNK